MVGFPNNHKGFPTKNDHFGGETHHLIRKHPDVPMVFPWEILPPGEVTWKIARPHCPVNQLGIAVCCSKTARACQTEMDGWITHPTPGRGGYGNPPKKHQGCFGTGGYLYLHLIWLVKKTTVLHLKGHL